MLPRAAGSRSSAPAETPWNTPGRCDVACSAADLAHHFSIRRQVFVDEQRIFVASDRDDHDQDVATLHVLGRWEGRPAGAVRLYPLNRRGLWKGDRLAVLPAFRQHRLGELLVRFAVGRAGDRGGHRMIAYIQLANVLFFEQLGWRRVGQPVEYVGLPHQQMEIPLSRRGAGGSRYGD